MTPADPNDSFEDGALSDLIAELESSGTLQDEKKIQRFSCACCRLIFDKLPPVAQIALEFGEDFSRCLVSAERLEEERVKLWEVLGSESCNFESPYVNAIRAVICCLYERSEPDMEYDNVHAVIEFCNAVENHQREQFRLLLEVFE